MSDQQLVKAIRAMFQFSKEMTNDDVLHFIANIYAEASMWRQVKPFFKVEIFVGKNNSGVQFLNETRK